MKTKYWKEKNARAIFHLIWMNVEYTAKSEIEWNWIELKNQRESDRHLKCHTLCIVHVIWQIQTSRQTISQFKSENNFKFINQINKPKAKNTWIKNIKLRAYRTLCWQIEIFQYTIDHNCYWSYDKNGIDFCTVLRWYK